MRNHHEKARDMARSVLPSTKRRQARAAKKNSSRVARRRTEHQLRGLERFVAAHDFDDFEADLQDDTRPDQSWSNTQFTFDGLVADRRDNDKIGPLLRWAEARVAGDPRLRDGGPDARRVYFSGLLPGTLIGRHALSHLRDVIGRGEGPMGHHVTATQRDERRAAELAQARRLRADRSRALDEVLASHDEEYLNSRTRASTPRWVSATHSYECGCRAIRPFGQTRFEMVAPWLLGDDRDLWLDGDRCNALGRHLFAFAALAELHRSHNVPRHHGGT